jgi:hypothetical protein
MMAETVQLLQLTEWEAFPVLGRREGFAPERGVVLRLGVADGRALRIALSADGAADLIQDIAHALAAPVPDPADPESCTVTVEAAS